MATGGIEYVFHGHHVRLGPGAARTLDPCEVARRGSVFVDGEEIEFERRMDGIRSDAFIPFVFMTPFELAETYVRRFAEAPTVIRRLPRAAPELDQSPYLLRSA